MAYGGLVGQSSAEAENVGYNNKNTSTIIKSDNVQGAIDQLFTSVSEGKSLVAKAVTDKGVQTALDATFEKIAENVGKIEVTPSFMIPPVGYGDTGHNTEEVDITNIIGENDLIIDDRKPDFTYYRKELGIRWFGSRQDIVIEFDANYTYPSTFTIEPRFSYNTAGFVMSLVRSQQVGDKIRMTFNLVYTPGMPSGYDSYELSLDIKVQTEFIVSSFTTDITIPYVL